MVNLAKNNYQQILEQLLSSIKLKQITPSLLLHCCCAPCSSYVLEYLSSYFDITLLFYNPNIYPETEYQFRKDELKRLVSEMGLSAKINFIEDNYEPELFFSMSKGLESCVEGSTRCFKCYYLRLFKTATLAAKNNFDYFTTTLTVSPHKNADKLNEIGKQLSDQFGINYLFSDFKKKDGYKRSIELSKKYNLYRQNYCGCEFSKR